MTGIVAHTYPEWWLKLTGQVAHWSTDYSPILITTRILRVDRIIRSVNHFNIHIVLFKFPM